MAQVAIFKQIFDKVRNNLNYHWFYSELKTSQCLTLHLLFSYREYSSCS
ncbi:putative envelope protein [Escherichia coli ISC7]|uniref:Envelope protein n=1 Tax=Escherichia coli ISC7 TaxID=1432555 RepID=W1EXX9_ECOLX|nr:putative envelope protein [Escherichia coli ISC7]